MATTRFLDLSRPVEQGMPFYPGDVAPRVEVYARHAEQGWGANTLFMSEHSGTHLDAPFHLLPGGETVERIPLERLTGPALVLDVSHRWPGQAISLEDLAGMALTPLDALILRTGAEACVSFEEAVAKAPGLSEQAARGLAESGVRLVGTDSASIDLVEATDLPAHQQLLGAGVPVVENLTNLGRLIELTGGARFDLHTFPLRITRGSGSPVRAVATIYPNPLGRHAEGR
jgi:arylformamidase